MSTEFTDTISMHIEAIAAALNSDGWLVLPNFLPGRLCVELHADCKQRSPDFAAAAIGRDTARRQASDQRGDTTLWLRDDDAAQREFLLGMEILRSELNRRLYLGLRAYEAHYAHYAPGAFYRRHRDAFARTLAQASNSQRILSSVFYLNADVRGGELVLWKATDIQPSNANDMQEIARISPAAGTAVFFLSAEFPHEVLPAQSDRYSIAGWFRD